MDALYQGQLLALARAVRGQTPLEQVTHSASIKNPTCGDEITISMSLHEGLIRALHLHVEGCALCEAGAGLLSEISNGASPAEVIFKGEHLFSYLKQPTSAASDDRFMAFQPVKHIKNRHKCVMLAFEAFQKATQ